MKKLTTSTTFTMLRNGFVVQIPYHIPNFQAHYSPNFHPIVNNSVSKYVHKSLLNGHNLRILFRVSMLRHYIRDDFYACLEYSGHGELRRRYYHNVYASNETAPTIILKSVYIQDFNPWH